MESPLTKLTAMVEGTESLGGDKRLSLTLARLEGWLEGMRCPGGYGGPVTHWWQDCLYYTGPGLDWRYEGIILGYLDLWEKSPPASGGLEKARRAGNDLVAGQLASSNFSASGFERNPYSAGTPHEAAADIGLLALAKTLRDKGDPAWETYLRTADANLSRFYIGRLWDEAARLFRDSPDTPSFVPNKSATLVEAMFLHAELTEQDEWVKRHAIPTLNGILACQVNKGPDTGAIYQNLLNRRLVQKFFPYYIARCIPALVEGTVWTGDGRYLEAASRAMDFILRWRYEDGSFPQVVYPEGKVNPYPQWIAGLGDILRAMDLLAAHGYSVDLKPSLEWLLGRQQPTGAFPTAYGFASRASQSCRSGSGLPDFRDILPVVGWNDKAFRYLASIASGSPDRGESSTPAFSTPCVFKGRLMEYREDKQGMSLVHDKSVIYGWRKGSNWADIAPVVPAYGV